METQYILVDLVLYIMALASAMQTMIENIYLNLLTQEMMTLRQSQFDDQVAHNLQCKSRSYTRLKTLKQKIYYSINRKTY